MPHHRANNQTITMTIASQNSILAGALRRVAGGFLANRHCMLVDQIAHKFENAYHTSRLLSPCRSDERNLRQPFITENSIPCTAIEPGLLVFRTSPYLDRESCHQRGLAKFDIFYLIR